MGEQYKMLYSAITTCINNEIKCYKAIIVMLPLNVYYITCAGGFKQISNILMLKKGWHSLH